MEYLDNKNNLDNSIDSSFDEDEVKDPSNNKLSYKQYKSDNLEKNGTINNKTNNIINQDKYMSKEHNNKEKENNFN